MTNPFETTEYKMATAISNLQKKIKELEAQDSAIFEVKDTTGNPTARGNFHFVINTFDNEINCYADGDWRTLASW